MRILALEAANIKRVKAIQIIPTGPLVKLAGANRQGKTSILDSIMWALAGSGSIQSVPIRQGETEGVIRVTLGDKEAELLVERKLTAKGEYLKVKNADGSRPAGGDQAILNKIIGHLTFDPVAFMREKPVQQLETLRRMVPLLDEAGQPLDEQVLDAQFKAAFTDRTEHNRDHRNTVAKAEGIEVPADLPDDAPSVDSLVREISEITSFNARVAEANRAQDDYARLYQQAVELVEQIEAQLVVAKGRVIEMAEKIKDQPVIPNPKDPLALQARIDAARAIEAGIASRTKKAELLAEAEAYKQQADEKTDRMAKIEKIKFDAIQRAKMPVASLGFGDNMVMFNGLPLDQASDAEQLQVSVAIAAALNPKLRVMRVRDGSILDKVAMAGLEAFGAENDYQIWIEIVDESGEVGLTIEDGGVRGQELTPEEVLNKGKGKGGETETAASDAPKAQEPDDELKKAARDWLATRLAALALISTTAPDGPQRVAALHGEVRAKVKRFPDLIEGIWNPAKLEKERSLKPKKAAE